MPFEEKKKHIDVNEDVLVSVIMPVHNSSKFVAEAVNSVLSQVYHNWELIIVDDASTDNTAAIIEELAAKDHRIKCLKLSANQGPGYCRNKATNIAQGAYIAFLDSDDLWAPEKLKVQLEFMLKNACAVSFTSYLHIDENGNPLNKRVIAMPVLSFKKQRSNNYIGNLTGMYHAATLGKIASPEIPKRQDWALWLEAIKRSKKPAKGIVQDLAFYRIRKDSVSANKVRLLKHNYNFYKKHLGYSIPVSIYFMSCFLWEYFFIRPKFIETLN
ncbi:MULTISPECIES: glycosyltransferase family 2 protein [Aequorivita]|uniref:Glycosyltransferase family 2 protein n=2 Tax=Aequorivita TaxID=153265 RepID=A0AB35YQH6_9FLAO|nr:glycosyltransferase family 2 protein [Aequorivita sp. Ant34-E75]WGF93569.1 glycosyltransferase family 2 protein [Aequorivita sp. Ant34-E75]